MNETDQYQCSMSSWESAAIQSPSAPSLLDDASAAGAPDTWAAGRSPSSPTTTIAPAVPGASVARAAAPPPASEVIEVVLPDGEEHKHWESLMRVFDALLANKCRPQDHPGGALGGGVIGDMTGYAAASRICAACDFVQVPTTLLSQVDSSVGGKTGINHPLGKNMIGAFYQPKAVVADTSTLSKPCQARELSAGLAEVIKYGCHHRRAEFFDWIEDEYRPVDGARQGGAGATPLRAPAKSRPTWCARMSAKAACAPS